MSNVTTALSLWTARAGLAIGALACVTSADAALLPGNAMFKTNPNVTETPKYTTTNPVYFTAANIVAGGAANAGGATGSQAIVGGLQGTVLSTVYRNPATGFLTFQYRFTAAANNPVPIVRATLGGSWLNSTVLVNDVGSPGGGSSGALDPSPEWADGDPLFIARNPDNGAPEIQWRTFGLGSALGPGNVNMGVFFETNASTFTTGAIAVIDTALVGTSTILTPIVPAPGAAALGLIGLGVAARRRR